jgi:hypothetical protein
MRAALLTMLLWVMTTAVSLVLAYWVVRLALRHELAKDRPVQIPMPPPRPGESAAGGRDRM